MDITRIAGRGPHLLFGGDVATADGVPVPDALITTCGHEVRADATGAFEVPTTSVAAPAPEVAR
ncbi:hypothetical protein K7711_23005 [Nocardia sp. CA2R105]|uniref:hypothetical protein n=1 Tax=Nocardia coffeae TaxID=2873381 RepID=UPI001CA78FDF|nr:hypothetical protein [Nocardia coffeae]MBY8859356.1 hypothetical protein [Nocardia coffeae]